MLRLLSKVYLAAIDARASVARRANVAREEGQALVEYGLILALIAVVSLAVLQLIGVNVSKLLDKVNTGLSSVAALP